MINNKISLDDLVAELELDSDASTEEIKKIITDTFVQIRVNNECGRWVDIQGFGSFHPLWYDIKKDKEQKTSNKKRYTIFLILLFCMAILFSVFYQSNEDIPVYKTFPDREKNKTTPEKYFTYTVRKGDSLYSLSLALYEDKKFWPLIYVENKILDMDKIYPGQTLKMPHILQNSSASEELAKVYIQTYKDYKQLGKDNEALWLLFWFNRYNDKDFIKDNSKYITNEDKKKLQTYMKKFH